MNQTQTFSILLVLSIPAVLANAADPPNFSSAPPSMGEAQLVGDILVVSRGIPKVIQEYHDATRKVGDQEETSQYTTSRTVTMPHEEAIAASDYRILDMQGKPVDRAALADRLSKLTPVLISDDGRRVDPQYLVLYKADTLIFYLRRDRPQAPAQAVPVPYGQPPAPAPVPAGQPT